MTTSNNTNGRTIPVPTDWCVVYGIEGLLILLGNSLTMMVFWRRKYILKRTTYLLINLALADSMVGISTILFIVATIMSNYGLLREPDFLMTAFSQLNHICVAASLLSLAFIALERVFAFVRPFHHRTTKTRYYYYAVCFVWVFAVLFFVFALIGMLVFDVAKLGVYISLVVYGTCLLIIPISYVIIWWTISKRPALEVHQRQQNKKTAITLSVITFFSLVTFVPGNICLTILAVSNDLYVFLHSALFAWTLVYGNSLVNPFVYVWKMQEFRRELILLLGCKTRRRNQEETSTCGRSENVQGVTLVKFSSKPSSI